MDGTNIEAPPGGWSVDEMLCLAGALFVVVGHKRPAKLSGINVSNMHDEHFEHFVERTKMDIHAAIEFCSWPVMALATGRYDDQFEPTLELTVEGGELQPPTTFELKGDKGARKKQ